MARHDFAQRVKACFAGVVRWQWDRFGVCALMHAGALAYSLAIKFISQWRSSRRSREKGLPRAPGWRSAGPLIFSGQRLLARSSEMRSSWLKGLVPLVSKSASALSEHGGRRVSLHAMFRPFSWRGGNSGTDGHGEQEPSARLAPDMFRAHARRVQVFAGMPAIFTRESHLLLFWADDVACSCAAFLAAHGARL